MFYLMIYSCIVASGLHGTSSNICQWDARQVYAGEAECNRAGAKALMSQPFDGKALVRAERHACVPVDPLSQ